MKEFCLMNNYTLQQIIDSDKEMICALDKTVADLIKARLEHNPDVEEKILFKMEGLIMLLRRGLSRNFKLIEQMSNEEKQKLYNDLVLEIANYRKEHKELRLGQAVFNFVNQRYKKISEELTITSPELDPYYVDHKVEPYLRTVVEMLAADKNDTDEKYDEKEETKDIDIDVISLIDDSLYDPRDFQSVDFQRDVLTDNVENELHINIPPGKKIDYDKSDLNNGIIRFIDIINDFNDIVCEAKRITLERDVDENKKNIINELIRIYTDWSHAGVEGYWRSLSKLKLISIILNGDWQQTAKDHGGFVFCHDGKIRCSDDVSFEHKSVGGGFIRFASRQLCKKAIKMMTIDESETLIKNINVNDQ